MEAEDQKVTKSVNSNPALWILILLSLLLPLPNHSHHMPLNLPNSFSKQSFRSSTKPSPHPPDHEQSCCPTPCRHLCIHIKSPCEGTSRERRVQAAPISPQCELADHIEGTRFVASSHRERERSGCRQFYVSEKNKK